MTVRQQWAVVGVVVAILATGLAAGVKLFADDLFPVGVGSSAPSFKAKDLASGATRTLADYRGQVVLLNVWATWCGYPESFVIDRGGTIRKKWISATDWNSPGNRALFDELLGTPSGAPAAAKATY
ncbi:MAG: hypothetical protein DMD26_02050 [Gemmatimonadetes bacterium]|nr:MAG: hypothetical protein DMD26_02050 [Gemmatimonadota bacterium]